jgi:hypothetical protein
MNNITKLGVAAGIAAAGITIIVSVYPEAQRGKDLSFWLWIGLTLSASLHVFSIPIHPTIPSSADSDSAAAPKRLVEELKPDVSPPTLAFLALADVFRSPRDHGVEVKILKQDWDRKDDEWQKRARMLEDNGLFIRSRR